MELTVNNATITRFRKLKVTLSYNAVCSQFSFNFTFNPNNQDHKAVCKPIEYPKALVSYNGKTIITGTLLKNTFKSLPARATVPIAGYSTPGVLDDSNIDVDYYPLQFNGLSLKQITEKIIKPYGLSLKVAASVSTRAAKVYDNVEADAKQSVKDFITELALQRKIVVSHDTDGNLLFTEANTRSQPIAHIEKGVPVEYMTLDIDGQKMHSKITVVQQQSIEGENVGQYSVYNPYVSAYRPKIITQSAGNDNDTEDVAKQALADELRSIQLEIKINAWELNGKLLQPNNTITVINPDLYIYRPATFFIEKVVLEDNNPDKVAILTCVLPEVYNGNNPKMIFQ